MRVSGKGRYQIDTGGGADGALIAVIAIVVGLAVLAAAVAAAAAALAALLHALFLCLLGLAGCGVVGVLGLVAWRYYRPAPVRAQPTQAIPSAVVGYKLHPHAREAIGQTDRGDGSDIAYILTQEQVERLMRGPSKDE